MSAKAVTRTTSRRGGNLCLHNNNNTPDSRGNASLLEDGTSRPRRSQRQTCVVHESCAPCRLAARPEAPKPMNSAKVGMAGDYSDLSWRPGLRGRRREGESCVELSCCCQSPCRGDVPLPKRRQDRPRRRRPPRRFRRLAASSSPKIACSPSVRRLLRRAPMTWPFTDSAVTPAQRGITDVIG